MQKIMNTLILAMVFGFCINHLNAQTQKEIKKLVVVEKQTDADGRVTEKEITLQGKEAEEYIRKMNAGEKEVVKKIMKKDKNSWTTKEGETIDLEGKDVEFMSEKKYKVVTIDDEGRKKVVEWEGDGEAPEDIKKAMEEMDIDMDDLEEEGKHEKRVVIVKQKDNNDEETYEFEFEGDELPEDLIEQLREEGIEIEMDEDEEGNIRIEVETEDDDHEGNSNKAQLGVIISDSDDGVSIDELIEGAPAEKAGLTKGDIIQKINDDKVSDIESLVQAIGQYGVGDVVKVHFVRDGAQMTKEVKLEKRTELFKHKTWNTVIEDEDAKNKKIKKEKKIIIKKK